MESNSKTACGILPESKLTFVNVLTPFTQKSNGTVGPPKPELEVATNKHTHSHARTHTHPLLPWYIPRRATILGQSSTIFFERVLMVNIWERVNTFSDIIQSLPRPLGTYLYWARLLMYNGRDLTQIYLRRQYYLYDSIPTAMMYIISCTVLRIRSLYNYVDRNCKLAHEIGFNICKAFSLLHWWLSQLACATDSEFWSAMTISWESHILPSKLH